MAKRLLNHLEAFRVPQYLTDDYPHLKSVRKLGRIFRDREELPASDSLEDEILGALGCAEFLIVMCSPSSAKSERVNFEIEAFLKTNTAANILCFIVSGQPDFSDTECLNPDNCIPPTLGLLAQASGKTPLAADARGHGDGFNLAVKKTVAGILRVELDKLMQREARRLQKRLSLVAVVGALVASVLTALVVNVKLAQNDAVRAKNLAQEQRARAENLIDFMVDDLVMSKLQQLGRVDVIDAVVNELYNHYMQLDNATLTPDELGRKARVFLELGRVYLRKHDEDNSRRMFETAHTVTQKMLALRPQSASAIYDHMHALYWLGRHDLVMGRYATASAYWRERVVLFDRLVALEGREKRIFDELGNVHVHLGWVLMERGMYAEARNLFQKGLEMRQWALENTNETDLWLNNVAGAYHHIAWAEEFLGNTDAAIANSLKSVDIYKGLWLKDQTDQRAHSNLARSYRWLAESEYSAGDYQSAKQHLETSLKHFDSILSYEPEDADKQLQYCWSAVELGEVEHKLNMYRPDQGRVEKYCPQPQNLISFDHVKAYNRLLGYRAALIDIEHKLGTRSKSTTLQPLISVLSDRLSKENPEVLSSAVGQRVMMRYALAVLKSQALETVDLKVIKNIRNVIQHTENINDSAHPDIASMVEAANGLLTADIDN